MNNRLPKFDFYQFLKSNLGQHGSRRLKNALRHLRNDGTKEVNDMRRAFRDILAKR